jgi:hypothetical protein
VEVRCRTANRVELICEVRVQIRQAAGELDDGFTVAVQIHHGGGDDLRRLHGQRMSNERVAHIQSPGDLDVAGEESGKWAC